MFQTTRCRQESCALPTPLGRAHCTLHDPAADGVSAEVATLLSASDTHRDLSVPGVVLKDLDLRGRTLEGCDFSRARLENVDLRDCTLRMVYFDFATLTRCTLRTSNLAMCVFAGATLEDCDFGGSEVVQSSFVGATLANTRFDGSDLYASRFVSAKMRAVSMGDCNLKEVHFDRPPNPAEAADAMLGLLGVRAPASNTEEAVFGGER